MPKKATPRRTDGSTKSNRLVLKRPKDGQTTDAATAAITVQGLVTNAITLRDYSKIFGELDLTECLAALIEETRRVQSGNLGGPEALLAAQAIVLNAMFTQLAAAASQMTIVDQIDRFTRLALKAQGQCRATLETLAAIKNPPTVFARQANIANGPQQVNNTLSLTRAENSKSEPNKLMETQRVQLDNGAAGTTESGDKTLAPMGAVNRPANR